MSKQEILAVEDDENILELVKYNLVKEGYDVYCVTSGEEAVTAARSQLPTLSCSTSCSLASMDSRFARP